MKLSKKQLKKIITEEIQKELLSEAVDNKSLLYIIKMIYKRLEDQETRLKAIEKDRAELDTETMSQAARKP